MNRSDTLDTSLRLLDPADRAADPVRARADLDAIVATGPTAGPHPGRTPGVIASTTAAPRWPRPARRVALLGGMVAAATAALVVAPGLTGGDRAFATWTATPDGMSEQQRDEASASCRQSQVEGAGRADTDRIEGSVTAVAERRGAWTAVVLAGTEGFSALCITDSSAGLFADAWIGSVGIPTGTDVPDPRELVATDLGTGTLGSADISLVAGAAGSDVVGVAHHSTEHGTVTATVAHGRFALWFPGDELSGASSDGVVLEVTYEDGSTGAARLTL